MQPSATSSQPAPSPSPTPSSVGGRTSTLLSAVALVIAVVALVANFALPGHAGPAGQAGTSAKAPLWAVVNADGSLANGSQVLSVAYIGTGHYDVYFQGTALPSTGLVYCGYGATIINGATATGFIKARWQGTYANGVSVFTFNSTLYSQDFAFSLAVFC